MIRLVVQEVKYKTTTEAQSLKKVTGQLIMGFIKELNAENTVNVNQHDFIEIRSCQMKLILF